MLTEESLKAHEQIKMQAAHLISQRPDFALSVRQLPGLPRRDGLRDAQVRLQAPPCVRRLRLRRCAALRRLGDAQRTGVRVW